MISDGIWGYKCVVSWGVVQWMDRVRGLEFGRIKGIGYRVRPFKPVTLRMRWTLGGGGIKLPFTPMPA